MCIDWKLEKTAPAFAEIRAAQKTVRSQNTLETLFVFAGLHLFSLLLMMGCRRILLAVGAAFCGGTLPAYAAELILLGCTGIPILSYFAYARYIEQRSPRTMGFLRRGALWKYAVGALAGTAMTAGAVMIPYLLGAAAYGGSTPENILPVLGLLPFWMIQGLSEELEFRGYFMLTLGLHASPLSAVCISALAFSLAHIGNAGITHFASVNLLLAGILLALIFLRTGSIWCGAALHTFWNLAQGNLFGISVSGGEQSVSVLHYAPVPGAEKWISGGDFGIEGSIGSAAVYLLAILIVWLLPQAAGNARGGQRPHPSPRSGKI
ncbi:MAG: CPBP family intramembrane metalloprotease [Oscillospiraceae bacterium]|nr:CPBP family intramembrane metalloprotease [Oscillospiraceae bacterium]